MTEPYYYWRRTLFRNLSSPERKDRIGDSHGGVILYVKDTLYYIRRRDLELAGVECLWIELSLKHKKFPFGLFYRPPNADSAYFLSIEDSIYFAVDTSIQDIQVTGDLNYNMQNIQSSAKIKSICQQFSLVQQSLIQHIQVQSLLSI